MPVALCAYRRSSYGPRTVPDAGTAQVNWKKIVQNINLIAILTGLVFFLCNIHLPKILDSMTSSGGYDRSDQYGDDRHAFSRCGLEAGLWKTENLWYRIFENDRSAGNHYPVSETDGTADSDGECKNDPADQSAGGDCADGGNDHTDGTTLQKRCCVCKLDQCIYHPGVYRNNATDGDAVYDIMSVSEPEACLHGYGERRMAVMIAAKQRQAPKVRIMK